MPDLLQRLSEGPLLLDGATGTELERHGAPASLPLWSAHALVHDPALIERIHADYVEAGCHLLTANTFRTQRRTLERGDLGHRAMELTGLAVELARRAAGHAGRRVWILGSAPTLEDCYRPDLVPDEAALAREHAEHAENLLAAGADAILVETMNTSREAAAAARAARDVGLPALVSFVCDGEARLLSGEPLADAVAAVLPAAPHGLLVNCLPPSDVPRPLAVLRETAESGGLPFGVYANLGAPTAEGGFRTGDLAPAEFANHAEAWLAAGARIVGGCCGTTPAHLRAVNDRSFQKERPG